jgi:outer membrane protein OmpA-like peptidoglycan-associated protein
MANDRDSDAISDALDRCPDQAEDIDSFEDDDGCPDEDNDADRIVDAEDRCPMYPEQYNGLDDEDGCPDRTAGVVIETSQIRILDRIFYPADSTDVLPQSRPILEALAATLRGNPQILLVEIQAHSDERGSDETNLRVTRLRAEAVRRVLISLGIEPERLRSAGYGERCPVSPEHSEEAWQQNRRVEFRIITVLDGEGEDPLPCEAVRDIQ